MSTNYETGVIIYCGRRAPSVQINHGLRIVAGKPLAIYNLYRLKAGLTGMAAKFFIIAHTEAIVEKIGSEATDAGAEMILSHEPAMIAALIKAAQGLPAIKRFMVYAENAAFPDCSVARGMLDQHVETGSACTVAPEFPVGATPLLFETEHLSRLLPLDLRIPQNLAELDLYVSAAHALASMARNPSPKIDLRPASFPEEPVPDGKLQSFPAVALVRDRHGQAAADRVARAQPDYGAGAAAMFKQFLQESLNSAPALTILPRPAHPAARPVLFSALTTDFTGAEQSLLMLLRALDQTVIHPILVVPYQCLLSQRAEAAGITVEIADAEFQELSPYNLSYGEELLARYRIRAVHIDFTLNPTLIIAARNRRLPIIGHLRVPVPRELPEIVGFIDRFVCISDYVAASVRRTNIPAERIVRVYNGVDLNLFTPLAGERAALRASAGIPADAFVVAFVARIVPEKQHDLLVRAISKLVVDVPNAIALFVGEALIAPNEIALKRVIEELGMNDHVRFWGYEPDIRKIYSAADVVVVCRQSEGFGRSIIEGMAMGVPAVVPYPSGCAELLTHGRQGLYFNAGSIEDFAAQLRRLALDHEFRDRCGRAAIEQARLFDIKVHAQQMKEVYLSLDRAQ